MNTVLILRFESYMQSWGVQDAWNDRGSRPEPTKSGVIGLLAAALGRKRGDPVDDLTPLRMAVRVEREGIPLDDFQTAGGGKFCGELYGVCKSDETKLTEKTAPQHVVVRHKTYIHDAAFVVFLEGKGEEGRALIQKLFQAVKDPYWPLVFGRRCCLPTNPIALGVVDGNLDEVAQSYPRIVDEVPSSGMFRIVAECSIDDAEDMVPDHVLSFRERQFSHRYVRTYHVTCPTEVHS